MYLLLPDNQIHTSLFELLVESKESLSLVTVEKALPHPREVGEEG